MRSAVTSVPNSTDSSSWISGIRAAYTSPAEITAATITITSIVDRFLEHTRVIIFDNRGDPDIYISSADWMTRNLDNRVEISAPILDETLKRFITDVMELQFRDTTKARVIDEENTNGYVLRGNRRKLRSQMSTYNYIRRFESV